MDKEDIKYEINNYIEIRKNLWMAVIVLTSGLVGLVINITDFKFLISDYVKVILLIVGIIIDYSFISGINSVNKEIKKLIIKLRKGDK